MGVRWRPWGLQGLGARRLGASHAGLGACGLVIGPRADLAPGVFPRRRTLVPILCGVLFEDGIGSLVFEGSQKENGF